MSHRPQDRSPVYASLPRGLSTLSHVDGHYDEQAPDDRARDEFERVFHGGGRWAEQIALAKTGGSTLPGERHYNSYAATASPPRARHVPELMARNHACFICTVPRGLACSGPTELLRNSVRSPLGKAGRC